MGRWVTDQLKRQVEIPEAPMRIISLVPSQTELLYELGTGERVVGITKFCVHPEVWFRHKTRIGGTKQPNHAVIEKLHPDLIIANKEENTQTDVQTLAEKYPVWVSDVTTIVDALNMIRQVGMLVGKNDEGHDLASRIEESIRHWPILPKRKVAYLIWRNPWMGVGANTFIHSLLSRLGLVNVLANRGRYPQLSLADLHQEGTEEVWLSSEPYPFKAAHIEEIKAELPQARVRLVDGELFSWYGSRMLLMAPYFKQLGQIG